MLRQRLLTAALLIPLFAAAILWLPHQEFAALIALVVGIGAWEWAGLSGFDVAGRGFYVVTVLALLLLLERLPELAVLGVAALWWLAAGVRLLRARPVARTGGRDWACAFSGLVVLGPVWLAVVNLHGKGDNGYFWVLFLIALIAVADSAAYFTGRCWGRNKLAPHVSPGKTWEGLAGAMLGAGLLAVSSGAALGISGTRWWLFLPWCLLTVAYSVVGDLLESFYKRCAGVKDSGRLLPGHGGVLDRVDSLTAAAPVFLLGLIWMERIA